ncbi:MAG: acetyl-CoA carboxylase biotin carboxylase subunit [Gammaproteobacteria bacterium]|nr:acetyl-CoA carboxylase biotin carboxylase subunit [Gammaproteobacteria bacterium]
MTIHRLLIANRGEIALRIIRTCQKMGIKTVLAASDADMVSVPAQLANQVVNIGPPSSLQSYLNIDKVVQAAVQCSADAIHPGYGFLSENAGLASACEKAGILFIGPTINQLNAIGDKLKARDNAVAACLPIVPGGPVSDTNSAETLASDIGFPVLVKAVGGGGGRGMQIVHDATSLASTLSLAQAEAENAFNDKRLYLETYVTSGRHVEVQILGDGNTVIHLGTRDCSIQRRYQKLVEEAPAPELSTALRDAMETAAVDFGKHLAYRGAGTVEFLVDTNKETFYFLEMNARIQVEHPVTEAITGLDLVAQQIRIAEGRPLGINQEDVTFHGHAIECRLNAEDCSNDFLPCPGTITQAIFPAGPGIRIDTHIESGSIVPPYYDSLLGKLIVWGEDRQEAVKQLQSTLARCQIEGVASNVMLHRAILNEPAFVKGGVDTGFLPSHLAAGDWKLEAKNG